MSNKLFVFHFRPIEDYPPVQNLLNYATQSSKFLKVYCFTSKGKQILIKEKEGLDIKRWSASYRGRLNLWFAYLIYTIGSLHILIRSKATDIVCYETISVLPVYLYVRFFKSDANTFLHFHEYRTPLESKSGSKLEYYLDGFEKYLLKRCKWVSHTNEVRLSKYLSDHGLKLDPSKHHELPNYPSKDWSKGNSKWQKGMPLKLVYVGYSLTEQGSYLKELLNYLDQQNADIGLDIYCLQENEFMRSLVREFPRIPIQLKKAVPYNDLAKVISQYHIGLILYKASTQNYIFNAPNKLFEYLSCGLDVWYPEEMKGIHSYDRIGRPKVLRLDFNHLEKYIFDDLVSGEEDQLNHQYTAESVYEKLISKIVASS